MACESLQHPIAQTTVQCLPSLTHNKHPHGHLRTSIDHPSNNDLHRMVRPEGRLVDPVQLPGQAPLHHPQPILQSDLMLCQLIQLQFALVWYQVLRSINNQSPYRFETITTIARHSKILASQQPRAAHIQSKRKGRPRLSLTMSLKG